MSALGTGQDDRLLLWSRWEGRIKPHLDALAAQVLYAGTPMFSAAGRVEQPHTAIGFASLLGLVKRFARWTAQGAVWLAGKGISSKATCFAGGGGGGLAIARRGRLLLH